MIKTMSMITANNSVSDMVRNDYRIADVFKKWGINYCCGGDMPLKDVCESKQLNEGEVRADIEKALKKVHISNKVEFEEWPIDFLIDYILFVHHAYLKQTLPALKNNVVSYISSHKKKYPYLVPVQEAFEDLEDAITEHMVEEEEIVFPYLKQIYNTYKRKETYGHLFVRTLRKPLKKVIESDHFRILSLLSQLRNVTNNYTFNSEACTNLQVLYHKLHELDMDMVQHKYLENEILFPKVMIMEKELSEQ
jgi:regulator of cell morphogenesis and NO signaling